MNLSKNLSKDDLDYQYPTELIATKPIFPKKVMLVEQGLPYLCNIAQILEKICSGDVLVINNTKVLKRRVFSLDGDEILFVRALDNSFLFWEVLFPAKKKKKEQKIFLPNEVIINIKEKQYPLIVQANMPLDDNYFMQYGDIPLPPYIQEKRGQRCSIKHDLKWYQSQWAKISGSVAAPTASLHFSNRDLDKLKSKSVEIVEITLHVGIGTFLPIRVQDLKLHKMHSEMVYINKNSWQKILRAKKEGKKIWVLGTTCMRAIESMAKGYLKENELEYFGETDIFISPGFQFQISDVLLTNFHQPKSSLFCLVAAFVGLEKTKKCYNWAIQNKLRLFSYGDLSVWVKTRV